MSEINGAIKLEDILDIKGINDPSYQKLLDWLESINLSLEEFTENLKAAPIKEWGDKTSAVVDKIKLLTKETEKANQNTKDGIALIQKAASEMDMYSGNIDKVRESKKNLTDAEKKFIVTYEQLVNNIKNGISVLSDESNAINRNEKAKEGLRNQIIQNIESLVNFQKEIKILTKDIDIHSESNNILSRYLKSLQRDYNNLEQQVKRSDKENQDLLATIQELNIQLKQEKINLSGANTEIGVFQDLTNKLQKSVSQLDTSLTDENKSLIENKLLLKQINKEIQDSLDYDKRIKESEKRIKQSEKELSSLEAASVKRDALIEKENQKYTESNKKRVDEDRKKNLKIAKDEIDYINKVEAEKEKAYEKEQSIRKKQELDGEKRAAEMNKTYLAEDGSINKIKFRLGKLSAQWALMGKASRLANQDVRMEMVALEKELQKIQIESKKTNFELTTIGKMWHSLKTFAIMSPGFFVFGAVYSGFQKLWELFDLGTKRTQEARKELEDYNQKLRDISNTAFSKAAEEKSNVDLLLVQSKDLNLSYKLRIDAIKELRKSYQGLFQDYTDEQIMAGEATAAEKLLNQQILLRASLGLNKDKIAAAAKRAGEAQDKLTDAEGSLKRIEDRKKAQEKFRRINGEDLQDPNAINPNKNMSPEEFLERQRLAKRTLTDKLFNSGSISEKELTKAADEQKSIIKQMQNEIKVYQGRAIHFLKVLDDQNPEKNVVNLPKLEAELQAALDRIYSRDLSKYGLTDKSTFKDVQRIKKQLDNDLANDVNEAERLKKVIAELKGASSSKRSGGRGKNKFAEEMRLQEETYQVSLSSVQSQYDNNSPNNTYDDDVNLTKRKVDLAEDNYNKKLIIIKKYQNTRFQDEIQYQSNLKDVKDKFQDASNKQNETSNKIEEDRRNRYDEAIKQIDDYNDRLRKSNEEIQKLFTKIQANAEKQKGNLSKTGHVNPLFAAFGLEDNAFNFKESIKSLESQINERNELLDLYKKDRLAIKSRQLSNSSQLDILGTDIKGNSVGEKLSNDKRGIYTRKYKETQEDSDQITGIDKKILDEGLNIQNLTNQKELDLEKIKSESKKELYRKTFEFSEQIANQGFENQKRRIDYQIQMLQKQSDYEMQLAGNNSLAKERIAKREAREMAQLRRKQAEAEKNQAVFNALVSAFANIAKTLSQYPLPLGAPILAINTAQSFAAVGAISSTKIPQYFKGKKKGEGKDEKARINELGAELVERDGNMFVMGGGKDSIVDIKKNDIIHTHEKSLDIMNNQKFINTLVYGTALASKQKENDKKEMYNYIVSGMIKEETLTNAFSNALKENRNDVKIQLPAEGLSDRLIRQQIRNGL
jgi:hypothetical protein